MRDYPQAKFFGMRCQHCRTTRSVLALGCGTYVEPPCAFPGCPDSPPGEGHKIMGPFGFILLDRVLTLGGWAWRDHNALPKSAAARPIESDGWITVYP